MVDKPPYLSRGRGRGQSSQKATGYSIGNLVIDRRADNKKRKTDTKKPIVTANAKAANEKEVIVKRKQRQIEDTQGAGINNFTNDGDDQESYQEQILENVIKSYKEGSNGSKYLTNINKFSAPLDAKWIWYRCKKHCQSVYR